MGDAFMTILRRAALDSHRFPMEVLEKLVAAIDINDVVDRTAALPASVRLDYSDDHFVAGFRLSRQLWQSGFEPPALIEFARSVRRGDPLDDETRQDFKHARARFKHLRFAFFLYSREHRSPPILSLVTLVMGELQDSLRYRDRRETARWALRLQALLNAPVCMLLMREADRLAPSNAASFRRFTLSQIGQLQSAVAKSRMSGHAFHAARKVISRQVSFHDDMRSLDLVANMAMEHRSMARWLATLNGLMGQFHDKLVAANATGTSHYSQDVFQLPEEIRSRLSHLIGLYLGTSNSAPPLA